MKHDKGLLKIANLAAFRTWLEKVAGFEVRDGKGAHEVLQVKVGPNMWAVINRNAAGELSSHPELRTLINRFKGGPATPVQDHHNHPVNNNFKAFHRSLCERFGYPHDPEFWWRDTISLEEHIAQQVAKPAPEEKQEFLVDLRDDIAMHALQGLLAWPGDEGSGSYHSNSDPAHTASMAYEYADAMMKARGK